MVSVRESAALPNRARPQPLDVTPDRSTSPWNSTMDRQASREGPIPPKPVRLAGFVP